MRLDVKSMLIAILLLGTVLMVGYCSAQSQGEGARNATPSVPSQKDAEG